MTLTPAYGRDYTDKFSVLKAFNGEKDFVETQSGRYINKQQIPKGTSVSLRYARLRRQVVVTV